jgi:hypothetical protein
MTEKNLLAGLSRSKHLPMTARDLEKAVQQCPLLVRCAEVAALLDHRSVMGEHSIPREQHSALLTAGLPRTEILKSLLVWTVSTFAPMSLLWFGRLLEERVLDRLQIGVAKATGEYTIQNPRSNPSEGTDAGDQLVPQFAHERAVVLRVSMSRLPRLRFSAERRPCRRPSSGPP